ncbi:hypothetical protein MASR1M45_02200 [Candidatus Kapaibacterium sp.]
MFFKNKEKDSSATALSETISYRAIVEVFLFTILVVLFLKSFVVEFYKVESGSMEPELFKNDIVVVSRLSYFLGLPSRFPLLGFDFPTDIRLYYKNPKRGDVVVIDAQDASNIYDNRFVIKRITGIPKDRISAITTLYGLNYNLSNSTVKPAEYVYQIPAKGDTIIINSDNYKYYETIILNEVKDITDFRSRISKNENIKLVSQNDYYFVQGDNFEVSFDSRHYGLIPQRAVIGEAIIMLVSSKQNSIKKYFKIL